MRISDWSSDVCSSDLIGIFHDGTTEAVHTPRINFHGVTVASRLPTLSEIESPHNWRVRVDIVDAPALQLVLPARKEMVENDALSRLREAAEIALYRAIAHEKSHRLSYTRSEEHTSELQSLKRLSYAV